jgi:hypothetical protein
VVDLENREDIISWDFFQICNMLPMEGISKKQIWLVARRALDRRFREAPQISLHSSVLDNFF